METLGITFEDVVKDLKLAHYTVKSKEGNYLDEWHIIQLGEFNGKHALNIIEEKSIDSWEEFLELRDSSLNLVYIYKNDRKSFDWFKDFFEQRMSLVGTKLFTTDEMIGKTVSKFYYDGEFCYPKISICFTDKSFIVFQTGEDYEERNPTLKICRNKMNLSKSKHTLDDAKEWYKIGLIPYSEYSKCIEEDDLKKKIQLEEFQKSNAIRIEADERKLLAELKAKYEPENK